MVLMVFKLKAFEASKRQQTIFIVLYFAYNSSKQSENCEEILGDLI